MNIRVAVSDSCWRIRRFTFDHTGFTGPGGFFLAKLLGSVRRKMLTVGLPAVLDDLDGSGAP